MNSVFNRTPRGTIIHKLERSNCFGGTGYTNGSERNPLKYRYKDRTTVIRTRVCRTITTKQLESSSLSIR
jgi:hypothetical protein